VQRALPVSRSRRLLDELEEQQAERYIDLCLVLRSLKSKGTVLYAGGRWDRLDGKWSSQEPESGQIIELHDGQVPFAQWYAGWLRDYRDGLPRDCSLALAGGARRGGKTYLLVALMLATALDVPSVKGSALRGWVVSAAHSERDEVDKYLAELMLPGWATYREWPQHRYKFAHGAELSNISADDPETLKRGRADVMLVNEAQKMPSAVLTNAIGGTSDTGGIALLAANPPQKSKGEWLFDVQQDIVNGEYNGVAQYFHFDPKLNPWIDHAAKSRVDKIIRRVSPTTALADEEGIWKRPGDLAYEAFTRKDNVVSCPDLGDITFEFTRSRLGKGYQYIGGYDPNNRPHHVGTVWKVYGTVKKPILWAVDEIVVRLADGEDHFLECVDAAGYGVSDIVWITDNSALFQDARRTGAVSADYFRKWGYRIEPNQPAAPGSKTGRPRNPDIEDRVSLVNKLLSAETVAPRMVIDPRCKALVEGLKNCPSEKKRHGYAPKGYHSHITDTAGYVAWWTHPRPGRKSEGPLALFGDSII